MKILKRVKILSIIVLIILSGFLFYKPKSVEKNITTRKIEQVKPLSNISIKSLQEKYQNSDIVGTISIDNIINDEIIVKSTDNSYYLNHNIKKEESIGGSLFLDYRINLSNTRKIIIYGHSSKEVEIPFTILEEYVDINFLKQHPNITLTTDNEKELYQIFSVMKVIDDYSYTRLSFDDDNFVNHLNELNEKSIYPIYFEAKKEDKVLILQTCSQQEEGKYIVISAVRVEKEDL